MIGPAGFMAGKKQGEYDIFVKCTRCRHKHWESARARKPSKDFGPLVNDLVCPKCGCHSFYKLENEQ